MGTTNPRARGVSNLRTVEKESRADRGQIRRLLSHLPEIPAAASGGIIGTVNVDSNPSEFYDDGAALNRDSLRYLAPYDPHAGTDGESSEAISSWVSLDLHRIVLTPGRYDISVNISLAFDSSKNVDAFDVVMLGGADRAHQDSTEVPVTAYSTNLGVHRLFGTGITYIDTEPLVFECRWLGASLSTGAQAITALSGGDPYVSWTITKMS